MSSEERADRRPAPVILIVDDDEYVHATLAAALRGLHPELVRASTAASGLELALKHRPDVAIVDIGLPDRDGYALTREIRARPELASLRICILTGYAPDEATALEAGADAVVGKPFGLQELLDTIRGQLEQGGSARTP